MTVRCEPRFKCQGCGNGADGWAGNLEGIPPYPPCRVCGGEFAESQVYLDAHPLGPYLCHGCHTRPCSCEYP